jgi:uncharacterized membrane protein YhaH (DUF805 family)
MSESGNLFGRSPQLNRKHFWIWIGCLVVAKLAIDFGFMLSPALRSLTSVDTVIVIFIALAIGARFRDAGWPRWLGIVLTLLIMLVLPVALMFAVLMQNGGIDMPAADPVDAFPWYVGWPSTICMIVLIVIAGTRPSRELSDERPQPIAPPAL